MFACQPFGARRMACLFIVATFRFTSSFPRIIWQSGRRLTSRRVSQDFLSFQVCNNCIRNADFIILRRRLLLKYVTLKFKFLRNAFLASFRDSNIYFVQLNLPLYNILNNFFVIKISIFHSRQPFCMHISPLSRSTYTIRVRA